MPSLVIEDQILRPGVSPLAPPPFGPPPFDQPDGLGPEPPPAEHAALGAEEPDPVVIAARLEVQPVFLPRVGLIQEQVAPLDPAELGRPVGAVQAPDQEQPLERDGVLVEGDQLGERERLDRHLAERGPVRGQVPDAELERVVVRRLPPAEPAGEVEPAEEPLDLPEGVPAGLLREGFARPGVLRPPPPGVHEGLAAAEVELGQREVGGPLPDGPDDPQHVMAAVDERPVRAG